MQKINIYTKNKTNEVNLLKKIRIFLGETEDYNVDTELNIYDEEENSSQLKGENTEVFCELFAYENKKVDTKKEVLKGLFLLISGETKADIKSISGVIHQLDKDHYISFSEHITIESIMRDDSFKTLGF